MTHNELTLFLRVYKIMPACKLRAKYANWFCNRYTRLATWRERVRRQAELRWAYDGALGQPRDCEEWQKKVWGDCMHLFAGTMPAHFLLDAMLDDKDTPWYIRTKINTYYFALSTYIDCIDAPKWQIMLLSALVGLFGGLHL